MLRSVIAVIVGYMMFGASAVALFRFSGRDPHIPADLAFTLAAAVYGIFFGTLGGFVAAWLAKRHEFEHALAVSGLIAVGGSISLLSRPGQGAIWTELTALLAIAPSAMLGGYLRLRQLRSR